ncbi:unnamed protein product [Zymoseptoria tritici ST99CH_1A5]|uniref:Uncharacterized protein n=1 Tax=Zymoseptoria tritici ST99CH_1A5 TaxID=1276529 RepID=A0A1Y6M594_ZYMTR|nr:unnamed protein product [Zymoseptoria tritici ST99CH_1A5]
MLAEMKGQANAGHNGIGLESVAEDLITLEELGSLLQVQNSKLAEQIKELKAQNAKLAEHIKELAKPIMELAKKPAKASAPATTTTDVSQPETPLKHTPTPYEDGMKMASDIGRMCVVPPNIQAKSMNSSATSYSFRDAAFRPVNEQGDIIYSGVRFRRLTCSTASIWFSALSLVLLPVHRTSSSDITFNHRQTDYAILKSID